MKRFITYILFSIIIIAAGTLLYQHASSNPDPVESVLERTEIQDKDSFALFKGYNLPCIESEWLTKAFIILIGAGLSAGIFYLLLKRMMAAK
jgi:hypothetical protein